MTDHVYVLVTNGEYSDFGVESLHRVPADVVGEMRRAVEAAREAAEAICRTQGYGAAYRAACVRRDQVTRGWATKLEPYKIDHEELWAGGY